MSFDMGPFLCNNPCKGGLMTETNNKLFEKSDPKLLITVSGIAINFDYVFSLSDPLADQIKILLVKNKKPPRNSGDKKHGGWGCPTGQQKGYKDAQGAIKFETRDEAGYDSKIIGKIKVYSKKVKFPSDSEKGILEEGINEIHLFLIEAGETFYGIREKDEIEKSEWFTLRQVFEMPFAKSKDGEINANGVYFAHLQRLYNAFEDMVFFPEDLIDGKAIEKWLGSNKKLLKKGMLELEKEGLLKSFLCDD